MRYLIFLNGICLLSLLATLLILDIRDLQTIHLIIGVPGALFVMAAVIFGRGREYRR